MDILNLSIENLKRFNMISLTQYIKDSNEDELHTTLDWYLTFLRQTDFILLRMLETAITEWTVTTDDIYIIEKRKIARAEVNRLQLLINEQLKEKDIKETTD